MEGGLQATQSNTEIIEHGKLNHEQVSYPWDDPKETMDRTPKIEIPNSIDENLNLIRVCSIPNQEVPNNFGINFNSQWKNASLKSLKQTVKHGNGG